MRIMEPIAKRPIAARHIILLLLMCCSIAFCDYEFTQLLKSTNPSLWEIDYTKLQNETRKKAEFYFNDKSQKEVRYALSNRRGILKFGGMTVYEALIALDNQKLSEITLSIFNRGDGGSWGTDNLEHAIRIITAIIKEMHPEIQPVSEKTKIGRNKTEILRWDSSDRFYQLKWSIGESGKKSFCEYLTLVISKSQIDSAKQAMKTGINDSNELKQRLKVNENGLRYLEIPMVNQGEKGYCVVAVLERILQYYGSEFDQHQLAQLAKTDYRGTALDNMLAAVKKADSKLGISMQQLYINRSYENLHDFQVMIKDYNRAARKANENEIKQKKYLITRNNASGYNISALMREMKSEIFIQSRVDGERIAYKKFCDNIEKNIDAGTPLVWCVILGLVKEKNAPQAMGAHMRLITGYNPKTMEISYSDSWGFGHEVKIMSTPAAWAITTWLGSIVPRVNNPR
ncbi:MAG: C39 family peptidase [Victivallaceae bacterium]|nr:C39 family peptidase [Victivallaceae bacterium]